MSTDAVPKIYKTFEDLDAYKAAREFRKKMYGVARRLPDFEKFVLADQIRRAALSLTNNIAEGHGRFHFLDQIKFMLQARGSLEELLDDLNVCEDESYLTNAEIKALKQEAWGVHKLLNGYIRFLRHRIAGTSSRVQESADSSLSEDELSELFSGRFNSSTVQPFNE
jgi:four helix bundle protein